MEITGYLLLLLIAHVLGDFYFQTEKMAQEKMYKYSAVVMHSLEYLLVAICTMIPVMSLDMFCIATCLSLFHFLIDSGKYVLVKIKKISQTEYIFIVDQLLHMLTILVMAYAMFKWNFEISSCNILNEIFTAYGIEKMMLAKWVLILLFLHKPSNILIQNMLSKYKPQESNDALLITVDRQAGRRIGTLERVIMLMFLAMNQYAALGLVLTAKSIARYDRIAKDEKFAEYYLLGTLLSTACVVLCKMVFL